MRKKRPVNLDLLTIKFPPSAIVSILHRMSGLLIFLFVPVLLWFFNYSLQLANFLSIKTVLIQPFSKFLIWIFLSGLIYHLVAGIRHLLMDNHIGETLVAGRVSAYITFVISFILIVLAGVWLWL
ncbi:MAG: succinate dehydrogenase, cytochrome b556 subunit [Gammaproteobacteria bacterium]